MSGVLIYSEKEAKRNTFAINKFKEELGITPAEYITLQKMDRAQMLLKTTNSSITDIAYQLGFSSSNYFCSVFKKTLSYSPAAYRKNFTQS